MMIRRIAYFSVSPRLLLLQLHSHAYATLSSSAAAPPPDPLTIYKERVAAKHLEESEDQIRALIHLRRLSRALHDYSPPAHLLSILARPGPSTPSASNPNPSTTADPRTAALVQYLTLPETLAQSPAPKGLLLTGPPGTGKSMLADLFFDSLPNQPPVRKWRRHYHHLLLEIYRVIWQEAERRRIAARESYYAATEAQQAADDDDDTRDLSSSGPRRSTRPKRGTGVFWKKELATDGKTTVWNRILDGMPFFRANALSDNSSSSSDSTSLITTTYGNLSSSASNADFMHTTLPLYAAAELFLKHGHVLLFDELQLVDVASANLLKRVLEAYWRLGGVVIGTSNRLPEELYTRGVQREAMLGFLEALRERCPVHEMRDDRDFRRTPAEFAAELLQGPTASSNGAPSRSTYFLAHERDAFEKHCAELIGDRQGGPTTIQVYSRKVHIPFSLPPTQTQPSLARFSFSDLFDAALGPADYLHIASTYTTIILTSLPTLTLLQKNQARRLITFLDAVYEGGVRLVVCADVMPDRLFFREAGEDISVGQREGRRVEEDDDGVEMSAKGGPPSPFTHESLEKERQAAGNASSSKAKASGTIDLDSSQLIQSEVLSEAAQDTEEGFRPNILAYSPGDDARGEAARSAKSRVIAEPRASKELQEAALKGVYAGLKLERDTSGKPIVPRDAFGFAKLAIFTGEEERFAFQRAVSRLYEMSSPTWQIRKTWRPLDSNALDIWAGSASGSSPSSSASAGMSKEEIVERAAEASRAARRQVQMAAAVAEAEARKDAERLQSAALGVGSETDFAEEASFEHRMHRSSTSPTPHSRPESSSASPLANSTGVDEDEISTEEEAERRRSRFRPAPAFPTTHHANERSVVHPGSSPSGPEEASGKHGRPVVLDGRSQGPPKLSPVHVWGVQRWGAKAGRWGQGAEAYEQGEEAQQARDGGYSVSGDSERTRRKRDV
ncbi:hypothetical protein OC846_002262 [Tilletia horrida]|uniref:AAA+ ATPase domain-containing protein n=1 Tax=Tilletia horrida TaxID=155126 RepID=A0AAN6GR85_9BASI|nr:hypothetical protein OC846_002262 [Tilletia horrida]KAK0568023.1 hypothetical protein OC861_002338 [Tilletia horrida]